jgi:hypothetical protein
MKYRKPVRVAEVAAGFDFLSMMLMLLKCLVGHERVVRG